MNKRLLLLISLVAFAFAGCSKSGNDPAPSLTGTWTWSQGTRVTTPKNGQASTVASYPRASSAVYTFDGRVGFMLVTSGNTQENGSYTYDGGALTLATTFQRTTYTVSELGAHLLVWALAWEDADNRYTLTETLTR